MNLLLCFVSLARAIDMILGAHLNVSLPSVYTSNSSSLVRSNFFGISIELSIINTLSEKNTSIPAQIKNYLTYIQRRARNPVRIRIGGNSMDDSVYNASQTKMILLMGEAISAENQPVTYGPVLYDVLADLARDIGGVEYLIGLSLLLREENNTTMIVSTAEEKLGQYLDAFLLGNEPDLYGPDGRRQSNYTVQDYFEEFAAVTRELNGSSQYGDLIPGAYLGGPTTCCNWALHDVLNQGYVTEFGTELKYINLQHYAQTNCFGTNASIPYFTSHSNVVSLAQWQKDGIELSRAYDKPVLMGEFNTASCGGVPGISDTFAATLWDLDYVLQLASVGYDGAFIHTRERGIPYNLFDPPAPEDSTSKWTTLPTYYALLFVIEALSAGSQNGSYVVDLNLDDDSENSTVAGYAVHDGQAGTLSTLVLLNYADTGAQVADFSIPSGGRDTVFLRTLTATNLLEKYNISWAGKTFLDVGDGTMQTSGFAPDQWLLCNVTCNFEIPSPGAAILWFDPSLVPSESDPDFSPSTNHGSSWMHLPLSPFWCFLSIPISCAVLTLLL